MPAHSATLLMKTVSSSDALCKAAELKKKGGGRNSQRKHVHLMLHILCFILFFLRKNKSQLEGALE